MAPAAATRQAWSVLIEGNIDYATARRIVGLYRL